MNNCRVDNNIVQIYSSGFKWHLYNKDYKKIVYTMLRGWSMMGVPNKLKQQALPLPLVKTSCAFKEIHDWKDVDQQQLYLKKQKDPDTFTSTNSNAIFVTHLSHITQLIGIMNHSCCVLWIVGATTHGLKLSVLMDDTMVSVLIGFFIFGGHLSLFRCPNFEYRICLIVLAVKFICVFTETWPFFFS